MIGVSTATGNDDPCGAQKLCDKDLEGKVGRVAQCLAVAPLLETHVKNVYVQRDKENDVEDEEGGDG